jgi:hypothetical protein
MATINFLSWSRCCVEKGFGTKMVIHFSKLSSTPTTYVLRRDMISTYDHRFKNIALPVRSAVLKLVTGRLVVRWVTTGEYLLLYVFGMFFFLLETDAYSSCDAQNISEHQFECDVLCVVTYEGTWQRCLPTTYHYKLSAWHLGSHGTLRTGTHVDLIHLLTHFDRV